MNPSQHVRCAHIPRFDRLQVVAGISPGSFSPMLRLALFLPLSPPRTPRESEGDISRMVLPGGGGEHEDSDRGVAVVDFKIEPERVTDDA